MDIRMNNAKGYCLRAVQILSYLYRSVVTLDCTVALNRDLHINNDFCLGKISEIPLTFA